MSIPLILNDEDVAVRICIRGSKSVATIIFS
jgi:hypothetical protein